MANQQTLNQEARFTQIPSVNINRSVFPIPFRHKTLFDNGKLIPIDVKEVLPGDTHHMRINAMVRLLTPLFPTMDKSWLECHSFFVPQRILWDHNNEFWGENKTTKWEQETEYEIPQLTTTTGVPYNSIFDYFGIPPMTPNLSWNALPIRAYQEIYNEWFRDQNLIDPTIVYKGDATQNVDTWNNLIQPYQVAKLRDYFTSALPEPQKGPTVYIPSAGLAEVKTSPTGTALTWVSTEDVTNGIAPLNLVADLQNTLQASINSLRIAFQTQKYYERDARHGSRLRELIFSHFGVTSSDARLQRPEYIGGLKQEINISTVPQTQSSTGVNTPQGWTTGMSHTLASGNDFTYSADEHGYIITVAFVRTEQTYSQGINRLWTRKRKLDFYFPEFANIGEQSIYNHEIYAQGNNQDWETFGFKEPWAEYRTQPNRISGHLRPQSNTPIDFLHYGIKFANLPILDENFINEPTEIVDRTIAQTSNIQQQYLADFLIENNATRPLPVYSIPGLIDHH